ncbi:hypothetical protein EK904_004049 [Melospiza melodia maxima]|nr:hypothetical protein EK904_004049 [Melospiza melodia maxima]
MLSWVQFGQWDKESGRGTSQGSTQQSVHISGLRPSSPSWKHSELLIVTLYSPLLYLTNAFPGVLDQGWQADFATRMVMPKKPGVLEASFNRFIPSSEPAPVPPIPNEQQLARLTDYVAFLEN